MQRRQIAQLLFASGAASVLTSTRVQAQTTCSTGPCYPITASETAASIVPSNYGFPPGNVKRYGATGNGSSNDGPAIQRAIDSGAGVVYFPNGIYKVGAPLRIRPDDDQTPTPNDGGTQNLTFVGEGRTNTYIAPLSSNITDSLGVNALIVNQSNNGKFSISNLRFWADTAYTGIVLHAVEGGAAGTGQAIFSGSIDNCWFGLGETATGVFRGALNNYRVSNCTFENMKGCFYRQGNGMGDVNFINNVTSECYDAFYDGMTDAVGDNMVTIDGLHVYGHHRGHVVQTQNSNNLILNNVMVQAASSPILGVGIAQLTSCRSVICSNFNASKVTIFGGSGPIGEVFGIAGSSVKIANGFISGADFGIRLTGNDAVDVTVDNVDIVNSAFAAFSVQNGTPSGRVRASNCNWSDSNSHLIVFTSAAAIDLVTTNCRFLNAGLTTAAARNLSLATSGTVEIESCVIGRDKPGAAASYFVEAVGSGVLTLRRPRFTGTAPIATKIGSQVAYVVNDPPPATL